MYSEINTKIQTILTGISEISVIYPYPTNKIDTYPAVIYYPSTLENSFEDTTDNFKIYGYKMWAVVNTENTTVEDVFSTVMPNLVDAILAGFDNSWDFDTIGGHRVWGKIETGLWSVSNEQNGIEVVAEFDLSVKALTS